MITSKPVKWTPDGESFKQFHIVAGHPSASQLIESIERDPSTSYWLLEQVRRIDKRDIYDLMRDVDMLKQLLDLKWDETTRELRAEQAKMVNGFPPPSSPSHCCPSMRLDRH